MKKAKTDSREQASSLIGFAALVAAVLVLAASYVVFPATAVLLAHAPWFSWQLDKDTMPMIGHARVGALMLAMMLVGLATIIAATTMRTPDAAFGRRILLLALAALSVPMAMHVIAAWGAADTSGGAILGTFEPDSWMRLSQVRDWLSGGGWYDHFVHRDNAPLTPVHNHWTRALDLLIALVVKLQIGTPLNTALIRAAILLPWVWTTLLVLALLQLAGRFGHAVATPLIVIALLVCDQVFWGYFMVGNADHHALLGALFAWAMLLLTGTPSARDTRIAGVFLALMLWISPEALVLIGCIYLYFGICWLRAPERANPLVELTTVVAMGVAAAVLIELPAAEWWVPVYDSLSVTHALLLLLCAGFAQCLARVPSGKDVIWRLGFALAGGAVVAMVQWVVFPKFFGGPMVDTDSYIKQYLLPTIFETQSLWIRPPAMLIAVLWRPLLAVACGAWLWRREPDLAFPLFMFLLTQLLFVLQFRWCYYSYPLTVVILAAGLGRLLADDTRTGIARLLMPLVFIAALEVPLALFRTLPLFSPWSMRALASTHQAHEWMYRGMLNDIAGGQSLIIAAPTTLGSHLLFWTPHKIVAAGYHRDGQGIAFIWGMDDQATESELRDYLRKRQVGALLLCFGAVPDGLLDKLRQGTIPTPSWLQRVPLDSYLPTEAAPAFFLVKQESP